MDTVPYQKLISKCWSRQDQTQADLISGLTDNNKVYNLDVGRCKLMMLAYNVLIQHTERLMKLTVEFKETGAESRESLEALHELFKEVSKIYNAG